MDSLFGIDLVTIIKTAGYLGIFGILFAESGILVGFFLPGDSLLFTAGFLASQGYLNIWVLGLISFLGAILGDSVGYAIGRKTGPLIFKREESLFFKKEYVVRSKEFYLRHGGKAIIFARFMPVVRTLAPILAGVGEMHYPLFFAYNVVGGILWAIGLSSLGYILGSTIPNIDRYLLPIVGFIVFLSILPGIIHVINSRRRP